MLSGFANALDNAANKVNEMADRAFGQEDKDLKVEEESDLDPNYHGPPGLELLARPTKVVCKQKIELLEVVAGLFEETAQLETANKYTVCNAKGKQLLYITEVSDPTCRQCCRHEMPLKFDVVSNLTKTKVLEFESPFACNQCYGCCLIPVCCCLRKVDVRLANGTPLGSVDEQCTLNTCCCAAKYFTAKDASGNLVYEMKQEGFLSILYKLCICSCTCELADFQVYRPGLDEVIAKVWNKEWVTEYEPTSARFADPPKEEPSALQMVGSLMVQLVKDHFTDADSYLVELPDDDVQRKALLLAATLVNDYLYNEYGGSRQPTNLMESSLSSTAPTLQEMHRSTFGK